MKPGSADHTGDVKPEGAGVAGEILLVYRLGVSCLRRLLPVGAHSTFRWNLTPRQRARTECGDRRDHTGLDIDQGMVVKMGGRLYYGTEAIHILALTNSQRASLTS